MANGAMVLSFDSPLIESLALPNPEIKAIPAGRVRCSFCEEIVPEERATIGAIESRMRKRMVIDGPFEVNGVQTFNERFLHRPVNGAACPKHALMIVPLTDKDNNIVSSGQKWPETE